jgi:hypothetical protein
VPLCHRLIYDRKKKQCPQHSSYSGTNPKNGVKLQIIPACKN